MNVDKIHEYLETIYFTFVTVKSNFITAENIKKSSQKIVN